MTTQEVARAASVRGGQQERGERDHGEQEHGEQGHNVFAQLCPSREVFAELADKWSMLILMDLALCGPQRFSELQRGIDGVSRKMLTQSLRSLERSGLVLRTVHPETPPRVVYDLLPLGRELAALLAPIGRWTERCTGRIVAAREEFDAAHAEG